MTLLNLIQKSVDTRPLLHFYQGFRRYRSISLAEIDLESTFIAKKLVHDYPNQSHMILSLPNCPEFVTIFFGILKAGKIPVPVTTADYVSENYYNDLKKHIRLIFKDAPWIEQQDVQAYRSQHLAKVHNQARLPILNSTDIALIQMSSGSTDLPKAILLSHKNILTNMSQIKEGMKVTEFDVLSSWLPFYHDMGLIGGLLSAIYNKVEAHFMTPSDFLASPLKWAKSVDQTSTTIIMGPNLLYRQLTTRISEQQAKNLNFSNIRLALCGSEPVHVGVLRAMAGHFAVSGFDSHSIFPVYGMAENALAVCFPQIGDGLREHNERGQSVVSCGRPLRDVKLRVVSESGRLALPGEVGEVQIVSPSMTQGYFENEQATKDLFCESWLRTGDLGFIKDHELYICGRKKEVVILNGKKYFPGDLEAQITNLKVPGAGRSAVFQPTGQEGYWVAVESKTWNPIQRKMIKQEVGAHLQNYTWKKPDQIILVAPCNLPRTSSGKLKRVHLQNLDEAKRLLRAERKWIQDLLSSKLSFLKQVAKYLVEGQRISSTSTANRKNEKSPDFYLREIVSTSFAEVMGLPKNKVNFEKSFFEYSLESVQIVQLNLKIEEELRRNRITVGPRIELTDFIQFRNLEDLVIYIKNAMTNVSQKPDGDTYGSSRSEIATSL